MYCEPEGDLIRIGPRDSMLLVGGDGEVIARCDFHSVVFKGQSSCALDEEDKFMGNLVIPKPRFRCMPP